MVAGRRKIIDDEGGWSREPGIVGNPPQHHEPISTDRFQPPLVAMLPVLALV